MRCAKTILVCLSVVALVAVARYAWAEPGLSMGKIIDNVRQNELLYENLDLTMQTTYDDYQKFAVDPKARAGFVAYQHQNLRTFCVRQKGMFHTENTGSTDLSNGTKSAENEVRVSDGHTTRGFDASRGIANIITGSVEDKALVRPHMLLMRKFLVNAPLSVLLSGHKALAARPNSNVQPDETIESSYKGEGDLQGLRCHRIWVTTSADGKPFARNELWLAEARNYIPARRVCYQLHISERVPTNTAEVTEWREAKPGIWFPKAAQTTQYDKFEIENHGRQIPSWRERYAISSVSLEPKHDESFFRELKWPKGTPVYEVKDGSIVRSYRE